MKLFLLFALLLGGAQARAALRTVTSNADDGAGSLRAAIVAANDNDTIVFDIRRTVLLSSGELSITKNLTITGPGANLLALRRDAGNSTPEFRVFSIANGVSVEISGLSISGGRASSGGGISNFGTLSLRRCAISNNSASTAGGGITSTNGQLTMESCTVSDNSAPSGAGVYSDSQAATPATATRLTNCTVSGNTATARGGGFYNYDGPANIFNCTITNNAAPTDTGSGLASYGDPNTSTSVKNSIISGNINGDVSIVSGSSDTIQTGGGNLVGTVSGAPQFDGSSDQINNNPGLAPLAFNGGPTQTHFPLLASPALDRGDNDLFDDVFFDQRGRARSRDLPGIGYETNETSDVGAVEADATLKTYLVNSLDDIDDGVCGVAHCSLREALETRLSLSGNAQDTVDFAPGLAGVITLYSALPALQNDVINGPGANVLTVERNTGSGTPDFRIFTVPTAANVSIRGLTVSGGRADNGGGIQNDGSLFLEKMAVVSNSTLFASFGEAIGNGGGIFNRNTLTIFKSTIANNTSKSGGGIASAPVVNGSTQINACTISSNDSGFGGGLQGSQISLIDSTVTDNYSSGITGENGGGVNVSAMTSRNSIIAGNSVQQGNAPDCAGTVASQGFNLIQNATGCSVSGTTTGNITGVAANLGPLQFNGGPTKTHFPLAGSPAIDRGSTTAPLDQRDFTRPEDQPGNANASGGNGAEIGAVELRVPPLTLVVNTLNDGDDGTCNTTHCSLREAMTATNVNPSADTINFANGLTGSILLSSALPPLSSVTMNGPGANVLNIKRSAAANTPIFRIFQVPSNVSTTITGITISNGVGNGGGGVLNSGNLVLDRVAVAENNGNTGGGGGIANFGTLRVQKSTIVGNSAASGGGIYSNSELTAPTQIFNSTISGNTATATGGGVYNFDGKTELQSCTVANNSAPVGSGITSYRDAQTQTILKNTIVMGLVDGDGSSGNPNTYVSGGYNLVEGGAGSPAFNQSGDVTGLPANLGPLAFNGGPTRTHALLSGSPAIDKGKKFDVVTDQRGAARPFDAAGIPSAPGGDGSDIGAFEFGPGVADTAPPTIAINTPANNASVALLPSISGTASDNVGVTRVDLYLQRKSDNKFWNGTTWTTSTALSTSLGGGTPRTWTRSSGLPSGASLAPGAYFIAARAYDAANNGTSATRNFSVSSGDTVAPTIAIAFPLNNAALKALPAISGTASDNAGVTRVDLYLQRKSDNKFWNGTAWTTSTPLATTLSGAAPRQWTRNSGLPSGANLMNGLYFVAARAYDAANNGTSATANFSIDTVLPNIAISSPAIGSTVSSFASASGTTSDIGGSGVVRVEFFLRRNADNKWWNGSAWVASGFPLATSLAPISGGQSWNISGLLPKGANLVNGSYLIGATAFDRANNSRNINGNFTLSRPGAEVSPSPIQLSSASAKSDGTIKLTFTGTLGASAGDAANYTITSNEQAVAIETVSQPQGSTVEFSCTPLEAGARVSVSYDIEDAQGRTISGAATVVVK